MKKNPLPETDLARIAVLPREKRRKALEIHYDGIPRNSYAPVRACYKDLFNTEPPLFGEGPRTPLVVIEEFIRKKTKSENRFLSNLNVAQAIFEFVNKNGVTSRESEFGKSVFPFNISVSYWLPYTLMINKEPCIIFIDPRKSNGLTKDGRRFAFSIMNEHIRVLNPDYSDVHLGILQFSTDEDGTRSSRIFFDSGVDLISYREIEEKSREVYRLWWQIQSEREDQGRKKSGSSGSLL